MTTYVVVIGLIILLLIILATASVRIVNEYERGVVFRLGRLIRAKGPGFFLLIPFVDRMQKVDLRIVTMDVPAQECITRDNVTVKVDAVVYFRVMDPEMAIVKAENFVRASSLISQTTLRSVLGQSDLDELLSQREKLKQQLQRIIDEQTEPWGVKVSVVEIRDVEMPADMRRAMAAQAEAERVKRAKVIHAEGEFQASERLLEAARIISAQPQALQLRYLQTLTDIATEKTTIVVFPLPIDLISAFMQRGTGQPAAQPPATPPPANPPATQQ